MLALFNRRYANENGINILKDMVAMSFDEDGHQQTKDVVESQTKDASHHDKYVLEPMSNFIGGAAETMPMYVLSNQNKYYGAAAILWKDVMDNCYKKFGEGYYVLPSSVHEVLLIPASKWQDDVDRLREVVRGINKCVVAPKEQLSNEIMFYNGDQLSVV